MATRQTSSIGGHPQGFAATARLDSWWVGAVFTVTVLSAFGVYATWAAYQGEHYYADPYLSPFYSPVMYTKTVGVAGHAPLWHSWFGEWPGWWPDLLPASPAFFILAFPGAFRFTCYYYRKAYYRSFAMSPPGCAVAPVATGRKGYKGETGLLVFQNLHRYAFYLALPFIPILYYDAIVSLWKGDEFGIGVGTVVLFVNATLLASYLFGCHSFRHLTGGHDDCMSCGLNSMRYRRWKFATWFNERHQNFAWVSLFWVGFTDIYVRLVSMGQIHDFNTWSS